MPTNMDYTNIESIRPRAADPNVPAGLAGMWGAQDRMRYQQQAGLQDLMSQGKYQDYVADAPVRQTKRLADIATNQGVAQTAVPKSLEELRKLRVGNDFDEGTLQARMGNEILKNKENNHALALRKIRDGMAISTMVMQAIEGAGPAGASAAIQSLQQRGIDVQNDPVVKHVLGAPNKQEMQARMQQIYYAFNKANQEFNNIQLQGSNALAVTDLKGSYDVQGDRIRGTPNKEHEDAVSAFEAEIREEHPDWSPSKRRAEAFRRYQSGRYSAYNAFAMPENRELEGTIAKLKGMLPFLQPGSDMHKRLTEAVNTLQAQRQNNPNPRPTQPGQPAGGRGRGTADDPIKLD